MRKRREGQKGEAQEDEGERDAPASRRNMASQVAGTRQGVRANHGDGQQAEIAGRMGVEPSNLSRILHGSGGVNSATFAAFLRACGFGFTVALVPFPKARARTLGRR